MKNTFYFGKRMRIGILAALKAQNS